MMPLITDEQHKNWEIAQRINRETRANSDSPYVGKFIGVWHGEIVAVGDTLDAVCAQLDALGDVSNEAVCIEASMDYDTKIMFCSPVFHSIELVDNELQEEIL